MTIIDEVLLCTLYSPRNFTIVAAMPALEQACVAAMPLTNHNKLQHKSHVESKTFMINLILV